MICKSIEYRNFRNIESARIELDPGTNVILGDNGQGKTNALEGIAVFSQGRCFRTTREFEAVRFGCDYATLKLNCEDSRRSHELQLKWDARRQKRFCVKDGVTVGRMSEFIGCFRTVLFCPQHLSVVRDGPAARRAFADMAISQSKPGYLASLQKYNILLSQRNALIRRCREKYATPSQLADEAQLWSEQLSVEAAIISAARAEYVRRLSTHVAVFFADMTAGCEKPALSYQLQRSADEYLSLLTENYERELRFGTTLYGAHRDDIAITVDGREARAFASQGQQRSVALALKLAEGEISREDTGEYPVFLFDDVLSELDARRRAYLLGKLGGRQVIITSCDRVETGAAVFRARAGTFTPQIRQ